MRVDITVKTFDGTEYCTTCKDVEISMRDGEAIMRVNDGAEFTVYPQVAVVSVDVNESQPKAIQP